MFTKEKLEKQINALSHAIHCTWVFDEESKSNKKEETRKLLIDLKHTLEQIYTSITSDGSI